MKRMGIKWWDDRPGWQRWAIAVGLATLPFGLMVILPILYILNKKGKRQ